MTKKYNPKFIDREEEKIFNSLGKIDLKKLKKNQNKDIIKNLKKAANTYIQKKDIKMNIRIDPFELEKIKENAEKEGLKYQTFVKSIIHKYITGQLKAV